MSVRAGQGTISDKKRSLGSCSADTAMNGHELRRRSGQDLRVICASEQLIAVDEPQVAEVLARDELAARDGEVVERCDAIQPVDGPLGSGEDARSVWGACGYDGRVANEA